MSTPSDTVVPEMILTMTIDDMFEILLVMHYLEITGAGMKREPKLYGVDVDWCVDKLQLVTERIKQRNIGVNCEEKV
jgi:hypothetical protein